MWICVFNETDTRFWLRQDTGAMNRPLRLTDCSPRISWVYVECFAEYSPRIRNPFRMHSRNVRNVFVICVLHIRRVKVWFLRCKSMVFGVQKGGFYITKVWFLFFECWVVAICLECYHNPSATFWQSVSSRRGPIYRTRIYIFATHFVCVWLILKACNGSFTI